MQEISVRSTTFERLQRHAKPFVDTPDMVVMRALDALERIEGTVIQPHAVTDGRQVDPQDLPDMKHTKVLEARFDGQVLKQPNWNRLLDLLLIRARRELGDLDALRRICPANIVPGRKLVDGYRHLSEVDLSVQGVSANEACAALVVTASRLVIKLEVVFMWRLKEGAKFPGEIGHLTLNGKG